jgi:ABC-type bacteriocin/lantibiotic exporter with double-glycine peptidase domain
MVGALVALGACHAGRGRVVAPGDVRERDGWVFVRDVPFVGQESERDCGAAALAMVLRYWGVPVDAREVAAANPSARARGLHAGELRDFARTRGLDAFLVKGEPADLRTQIERHRPLIVGLARQADGTTLGHYEVVIGFHHARHRILTLDPAAGWRDSSMESFAAEWAGAQQLALVVFRREP